MKPQDLASAIAFAISNKLPLLVKGAPGTGKSDIIAQACIAAEADLIISHPVVSDPTDYKGLPFPSKDGNEASFLPFGDLNRLIKADKTTVFFLDDLGQAPMSVQAACMQLILARQINGHKISDHVVFLAATNRREDKAGVTGILEPVKSRFSAIVQLDVDVEDWVTWALANHMPPELMSFIRYRPNLLHDFKPTNDLENSPCPRTVAYVGRIMNANLNNLRVKREMMVGAVGKGFVSELMAFIETYMKLPPFSSICTSPSQIPIPEDPSSQYAICGMIASKVDATNFDSVMIFVNRMKKEFQVLVIKDSVRRKRAIATTKSFVDWAGKNTNVIL